MSELFAITDIETTGGNARTGNITEVAVVISDGQREIDRFHSLVNPNQPIPFYIQSLTGISNEMVADAPEFGDIAAELMSFYEDAVFVAHNVGFDYSFLRAAFEHSGYSLHARKLCTVRIARKLFPGLPSYSLGNLCRHFEIDLNNAHRALSDTLATVELFHHFHRTDEQGLIGGMLGRSAPEQWLPPALPREQFDMLPERPGVYYLRDVSGQALYIGMSMNVKKRIRQHFNGKMASERRQAFLKDIANIDVCETGTELLAALLEDREIRTHRPKYNRAQKHKIKTFALTQYIDRNNYIRLTLTEHKGLEPAIKTFNSLAEGRDWLLTWARTHHIPLALCGIDLGSTPLPPADESNAALLEALAEIDQPEAKVILFVGDGRNYCETSVVATQGDRLLGYAFVPNDVGIQSIDDLEHYLEPLPHSELSSALLRRYAAGLRIKELIHPAV